jgi:hypothetical protein
LSVDVYVCISCATDLYRLFMFYRRLSLVRPGRIISPLTSFSRCPTNTSGASFGSLTTNIYAMAYWLPKAGFMAITVHMLFSFLLFDFELNSMSVLL